MEDRSIRFLVFGLIVLLVAVVSFTVGTAGAPTGGESNDDDASLLRRMHELGARFHDGGGHGSGQGPHGGVESHHRMAVFLDSLNLTEEQRAHVDAVHEAMAFRPGASGVMGALHEELVGQLGQGSVDRDSIDRAIEEHLARMRTLAYTVSDEVVTFVDSLDESQRRQLQEHLEQLQSAGHGRGH